jgi:thiosulfate dehydrogenase [quinone] large subunit
MIKQCWRTLLSVVQAELRQSGAYLVPLRVFIGIGWLRACAEKIADPGWGNGSSVGVFLTQQLDQGQIVFPFYQRLVVGAFLPHAAWLSWVILLGELLAGLAILSGCLTNAALLGGLFMNLNFLLAGRPDPNAFYIVIQMVLLLEHTGSILGVDALLKRYLAHPLVVAQHLPRGPAQRIEGPLAGVLAVGCAGTALYAFAHIVHFAPDESIRDPAAVLCVLAVVGCIAALTICLRREWQPFQTQQGSLAQSTPRLQEAHSDHQ